MNTPQIAPQPASTYQLLLDAASAWPDGVATQWIPDPGEYTDCLAWTYADLAATVTQIANALTALGVRRADAVTLTAPNTAMLYAATLAAQAMGIAAPVNPALSDDHLAGLIRRAQSRVVVTAGPELNEQLWRRMLPVARQAGVTAILAIRPDGAHGDPPVLAGRGSAGSGLLVAYLDDVIAGQPIRPPDGAAFRPGDLAAFVHTGGTTGAPKIAAHTHANRSPAATASLRPRAGARRGGTRRPAAVPRQRPARHRYRSDVRGRPGGVARPGRLPRPGRVRPVLEDRPALPDRGHVCRPHRLRRLAQVPVDALTSAHSACPSWARPRFRPRCGDAFAARNGRRLLEGYGLGRGPPAPPPSPRPGRNGPDRSVASCLDSRSRPSGSAAMVRGPTVHPARPEC